MIKSNSRHQPSKRILAAVVTLFAACALWAQPKTDFIFDRDILSSPVRRGSHPRWEGAFLVAYDNNFSAAPTLTIADRTGKHEEVLFTFPEAGQILIADVAVSREGEVAVAGGAHTGSGVGSTFLARISRDRKHQVVTQLWPYVPMVVTFAADGTLWTMGHLKDNDNKYMLERHILRRFDASGRMLSSVTVRGARQIGVETSLLRASRDRVGWYNRENEYVEFAPDSNESERFPGPPGANTDTAQELGISDNNDVVMGVMTEDRTSRIFYVLNRVSRTWSRVSFTSPDAHAPHSVYGFDGMSLVTDWGNGNLRLYK